MLVGYFRGKYSDFFGVREVPLNFLHMPDVPRFFSSNVECPEGVSQSADYTEESLRCCTSRRNDDDTSIGGQRRSK